MTATATDTKPRAPRSALTGAQLKILNIIATAMRQHQRPPSIREMGLEAGIRSLNGVHCHLKALARKGVIALEPNMARGIRLTPAGQMIVGDTRGEGITSSERIRLALENLLEVIEADNLIPESVSHMREARAALKAHEKGLA